MSISFGWLAEDKRTIAHNASPAASPVASVGFFAAARVVGVAVTFATQAIVAVAERASAGATEQ